MLGLPMLADGKCQRIGRAIGVALPADSAAAPSRAGIPAGDRADGSRARWPCSCGESSDGRLSHCPASTHAVFNK